MKKLIKILLSSVLLTTSSLAYADLNVLNLSVDTSVSEDVSVSEDGVPAPPNTGSGLDLKPNTASPFNSDGVFILVFASLFVLSISYRMRMLSQEK